MRMWADYRVRARMESIMRCVIGEYRRPVGVLSARHKERAMWKSRGSDEHGADVDHDAGQDVGKRTLTASVQRKAVQLKGDAPSDPSTVTATAEAGLQGSSSEVPHRAALESGFGVDLGHVRAHTGDGAA